MSRTIKMMHWVTAELKLLLLYRNKSGRVILLRKRGKWSKEKGWRQLKTMERSISRVVETKMIPNPEVMSLIHTAQCLLFQFCIDQVLNSPPLRRKNNDYVEQHREVLWTCRKYKVDSHIHHEYKMDSHADNKDFKLFKCSLKCFSSDSYSWSWRWMPWMI